MYVCILTSRELKDLVASGENCYWIKFFLWSSLKKTLTSSRCSWKQSLLKNLNTNALLGTMIQMNETERNVRWARKKVESKHKRVYLWADHSSIQMCNQVFGHTGLLQSGPAETHCLSIVLPRKERREGQWWFSSVPCLSFIHGHAKGINSLVPHLQFFSHHCLCMD